VENGIISVLEEGCLLQLGGSDQMGNISAGQELISRTQDAQVEKQACHSNMRARMLKLLDLMVTGVSKAGVCSTCILENTLSFAGTVSDLHSFCAGLDPAKNLSTDGD
jgi:hypothetical protein